MTPRNIFIIILKVLGIFFIKEIIEATLQLLSTILLWSSDGNGDMLMLLFFSIIILGVYFLVSYFLIFKSGLIIDKLKLDQGFDQSIMSVNIPVATILNIALIVIGAFVLINEIPQSCRLLYAYISEKRMTFGETQPDVSYIIYSAIKIIIALLLIGERKRIIAFVERKQIKEEKQKNTEE